MNNHLDLIKKSASFLQPMTFDEVSSTDIKKLNKSLKQKQKNITSQLKHNPSITIKSSVRSNPFLKMLFRDICKKFYRSGSTFDQSLKAPTTMNLNKWMIFCKEFNLTNKIRQKQLHDAFKKATEFRSQMNIDQFIIAIEIIERIFHRTYFNQKTDFVKEFLHLSCLTAYKLKVNNFKISTNTNLKNSFIDACYTQQQKIIQKKRQQNYKKEKRKRELILIKGMLSEHLYDQICQKKNQRKKHLKNKIIDKKQCNSNITHLSSNDKTLNPQKFVFTSNRILSYSQRFNYFNYYRKLNISQTKSSKQSQNVNSNKNDDNKIQQNKQTNNFLQQIYSNSSQESDQILKEHFLLQKSCIFSTFRCPQLNENQDYFSQKIKNIQIKQKEKILL